MKVSAIRYLVDAGPLVGLLDADDQWHEWSRETLSVIEEPVASTETAVAEACHHLRRHRPALAALIEMVATGRVILVPTFTTHPERLAALLKKYPLMDAGDATLVVLSEVFPRAKLVTIDVQDFRLYRRQDGRAVPTIMPPARK